MPERRALRIVISSRFATELKHQIGWITKYSAKAADAADSRVRVAVARLARYPLLGRPGRIAGTRELTVPKTRLIVAYRVTEDSVEVAALRHSSQLWPTDI